jgi:hypothetical protein
LKGRLACDLLVSTVPLWVICKRQDTHKFRTVSIMVTKRMEYTGLRTFFGGDTHGIIYNGTTYGNWYRTSHIFGHSSTEASDPDFLKDNPDAEPGYKIVGNNCDCHPNIIRAGRMGKWERGVLTHHAYEDTIKAIAERQ